MDIGSHYAERRRCNAAHPRRPGRACPLGPNRDATSTSRRPNTQIGAVSHDVAGMRGCMHGAKTGVGREKCRLYQAEPGAIGEVGLPEPSLPSRIRTSIALLSAPFAELVCLSSLVLCRSCWRSWRSCAFFFFFHPCIGRVESCLGNYSLPLTLVTTRTAQGSVPRSSSPATNYTGLRSMKLFTV